MIAETQLTTYQSRQSPGLGGGGGAREQASNSTTSLGNREKQIKAFEDMGFPRTKIVKALRIAEGDQEAALHWLCDHAIGDAQDDHSGAPPPPQSLTKQVRIE